MKINSLSQREKEKYNRTKLRQLRQVALTSACDYSVADTAKPKTYSLQDFSVDENGYYRAISEGVMVDQDGNPYQVIAKGAIKRWYDDLPDDVEYPFDLQHDTDNPIFNEIGTWTKKDLLVKEEEDERYSLWTKLNLDENSFVVKELRRKHRPLGLSIEFYSVGDFKTFQEDDIYVHEDIDIQGIGIVNEPQDSLAGNIYIDKGEYKMDKSLKEALMKSYGIVEDTPAEEETTEEVVETVEETEEQTEEVVETEVEEEQEDVEEDATEEVEEPATEQVQSFTLEDIENVLDKKLTVFAQALLAQDKETQDVKGQIKEVNEKLSKLNSFKVETSRVSNSNARLGF